MIKLSFSHNREILHFAVRKREIWYRDRIWANGIRCIPKDEEFVKKIVISRNKLPSYLLKMFDLPEKDRLEYEACNTEGELADKIKEDCKMNGLILISEVKE
jgi:hypothetical protein